MIRHMLGLAALATVAACGPAPKDTAADEDVVTQTKLYDIAKNGNTAEFEMAWAQAAQKSADAPDPRTGQSLAHYAAENRLSPLMIHTVMMVGANPNLKDAAGLTPLRHAIMANNQVAIRNLAVRTVQRLQQDGKTIPVRLDIAGPDGLTDEQTCRSILDKGMQHRGCEVLFEVVYKGAVRSTPEQVNGVLNDLGQARSQQDLQ